MARCGRRGPERVSVGETPRAWFCLSVTSSPSSKDNALALLAATYRGGNSWNSPTEQDNFVLILEDGTELTPINTPWTMELAQLQ
jgi:hypothetical protein